MDVSEIMLNGNGAEAWVRWKGDVEVRLVYVSPETDRRIKPRIMKDQWKGHQRMEKEIDDVALRDYYCGEVIKGMRGLTRDGQSWEPAAEDLKRIWDGNHDFGLFCIQASRELGNFIQEKKA